MGEAFNPQQELEEVRKVPKSERKEKLADFKENLFLHQQGLARVQEEMIKHIRANPDASLEQLNEEMLLRGALHGINEKQKHIAELVLQAYVDKHRKVHETRQQYPADRDLYHALFGLYPRGEVEIVEGPMTLYVRCYDLGDYTLIHSQKFLGSRNWSDADEQSANSSAGVSIGTSLIPGLEGTIIAEKASRFSMEHSRVRQAMSQGDLVSASKEEKDFSQKIFLHEEQHAIKRLFAEPLRKNKFKGVEGYFSTADEKEKYFRWLRGTGEEHARDEVLAFFKDGTPAETVLSNLMRPQHEGGIYDYFADERKEATDLMRGNQDPVTYLLAGEQGFSTEEKTNLLKVLYKVFVEEYELLLKDGINACERLTAGGWSKNRVIGLLIHEPLSNWKKVVDRLLESKK